MSTATDEQVITGDTPPQAENWGDPNVDMMAEMDKFFDSQASGEEYTPSAPKEAPATPAEPEKPAETPAEVVPDKPAKTKEAVEGELPDIAEDFFPDASETLEDTKEEVKPGDFDEEAFDKQTEEEVKGMEAKAGEKFRALKAELKEAKKTTITPDVQNKLKELEIKAAEVDGLKERMVELSSASAKLQMENEQVYQDQVVKPAASIFTNADKLSETVGLEPNILRAIIRERNLETQEALMEEHFGSKSLLIQSKVAGMAEGFNNLVSRREEMMADAEARIERSRAERVESDKRLLNEHRVAVQTLQKDLWKEHEELIPGLLDDDGNKTDIYKKLMARGLAIDFGMARAQDQARAALSGTVLPHALKQIRVLQTRLSAYEAGDKKKVRSSPAAGSSVSATPADGNKPKTFEEAMAADYNFTS